MLSARKRLKKWRLEKELSSRGFSRELGAAENAISRIESGERLPGRDLAIKIFNVTGIDPADWNAKSDDSVKPSSVKKITKKAR